MHVLVVVGKAMTALFDDCVSTSEAKIECRMQALRQIGRQGKLYSTITDGEERT